MRRGEGGGCNPAPKQKKPGYRLDRQEGKGKRREGKGEAKGRRSYTRAIAKPFAERGGGETHPVYHPYGNLQPHLPSPSPSPKRARRNPLPLPFQKTALTSTSPQNSPQTSPFPGAEAGWEPINPPRPPTKPIPIPICRREPRA